MEKKRQTGQDMEINGYLYPGRSFVAVDGGRELESALGCHTRVLHAQDGSVRRCWQGRAWPPPCGRPS